MEKPPPEVLALVVADYAYRDDVELVFDLRQVTFPVPGE
jgi:hypothetical protein